MSSNGFRSSGATPRALFPKAWRYYDGVIATAALIFMVVNALVGLDVFSADVDRWIGVGITAVTAVLIWMRARATQLGVVTVGNGHLTAQLEDEDDTPGEHRKPEPDA